MALSPARAAGKVGARTMGSQSKAEQKRVRWHFQVLPGNRRQWKWCAVRMALVALLVAVFILLMTWMPGRSHRGPLPPLTAAQRGLSQALRAHVNRLAREIGERHVWKPAQLSAAAAYIEDSLREAGWHVSRNEYNARGRRVWNIEAVRAGARPGAEVLIVGAHYDSVAGSPGANDNATGVAALLELARALPSAAPQAAVRLVAFVNEEPPFFQEEDMGSRVYARGCRERGDRLVGMLCLESIGCYSDEPGSQRFPVRLLALLYPSRGNFVGFVGNPGSRGLLRRSIGTFRRHAAFPSEGLLSPSWVPGVDWSDHWSFWQEGYPAIMVTDTAPFRDARYHTEQDTPDGIDFDRLARVTDGLVAVVRGLAPQAR